VRVHDTTSSFSSYTSYWCYFPHMVGVHYQYDDHPAVIPSLELVHLMGDRKHVIDVVLVGEEKGHSGRV